MHCLCSWVYANPRWLPDGGNGMRLPLDYTHMGMLAILPSGQLAAAFQVGNTAFVKRPSHNTNYALLVK